MIDEYSLSNFQINFNKLLKNGFLIKNNKCRYEKEIINHQFSLIIEIDKNNIIVSDVIELPTKEKFLPYYIQNAMGHLVAEMREEYDNIINVIKKECQHTISKGKYLQLIILYIKDKYGDDLEYLWEKSPNSGIWRNKSNHKWYAIIMTISSKKLGLVKDDMVEIIDIRLLPEEIVNLVDNSNYFYGYHMNKKHWITIRLDGSVDIEIIYSYIDISYQISINK